MQKICEVCTEASPKYKCPKCAIKYCSVSCYKEHKDSTCKSENIPPPSNRMVQSPPVQTELEDGELSDTDMDDFTEDKVEKHLLEKLADSQELRLLLGNPHLRVMMTSMTAAEDPGKIMEAAMKEPIFTEFADECLKIIEPDDT